MTICTKIILFTNTLALNNTHSLSYTHACTHTHTYAHTHTRTHTHTHTHTHTLVYTQSLELHQQPTQTRCNNYTPSPHPQKASPTFVVDSRNAHLYRRAGGAAHTTAPVQKGWRSSTHNSTCTEGLEEQHTQQHLYRRAGGAAHTTAPVLAGWL